MSRPTTPIQYSCSRDEVHPIPHLILLGDSIFDNAAYTEGGPDVVTQLNAALPAGWGASLLAVDGSTTDDIAGQVGCLLSDASHLVLSVGGNDALQQAHLLFTPAASTEEALGLLADLAEQFEHDYRAAVAACLHPGLPLTICTVSIRNMIQLARLATYVYDAGYDTKAHTFSTNYGSSTPIAV